MFKLSSTANTPYENLSDEELLRELEVMQGLHNRPLVVELGNRVFINTYFHTGETINGKTDDDYRDAAVDDIQEVAGEDFHSDVIKRLTKATSVNKQEMVAEIKAVIELLTRYDMDALNLIASIRADGLFR